MHLEANPRSLLNSRIRKGVDDSLRQGRGPSPHLAGHDRLQAWHERCRAKLGKPIVQLQEGIGRPLFFFHGDLTGGGVYARRMARLLGPEQPFIVVAPHELHDDAMPFSIEKMAVDRLPSILAAQPSGPYRLAGYCNGALVAFEVARLLVAAGHRVEFIALIVPPTLNARSIVRIFHRILRSVLQTVVRSPEQRRVLLEHVAYFCWRGLGFISRPELFARAWRKLKRLAVGLRTPGVVSAVRQKAKIVNDSSYTRVEIQRLRYERIVSAFIPDSLDVPGILFVTRDPQEGIWFNAAPWKNINPDIEEVGLPGDHHTCVNEGLVVIAEHLRARIAQSTP